MFDKEITLAVKDVLDIARSSCFKIATAESCTGGLIAAALTSVAGSSIVFERGFVTYSNEAKTDMLGVAESLIKQHGAVSDQVARTMCEGAIRHSNAKVAVSVTGIAGPGGGTDEKPVGTIHLAVTSTDGLTQTAHLELGNLTREEIRHKTVLAALAMLNDQMAGHVLTA